ncbi:MAG: hypothetical protein K9I95_03120 [Flavobacteriaceae bacterium]|nr:hypothetical protein [Flavobacteriaceae bacterium]
MKNYIKKIKIRLKEFIYKRYNISFWQGGGDDIQLNKLLKRDSKGVFVDIGCWHPTKGSNTYYFYLRGWKGICIDPNPQLGDLYKLYRPKVIQIETDLPIKKDVSSEIVKYLELVDYVLVGKSVINGNLGNLFLLDKKTT